MDYSPLRFEWEPLFLPDAESRMRKLLTAWAGTPYASGQDCCGVAADCIGFGFRIIDSMFRRPTPQRPKLPPDTSMHDRRSAARTMVLLRRLYPPCERVRTRVLNPMDLVVTGPAAGGPGHLMLVGPDRNQLWQAIQGSGVSQTGWSLPDELRIFRVYRFLEREQWI